MLTRHQTNTTNAHQSIFCNFRLTQRLVITTNGPEFRYHRGGQLGQWVNVNQGCRVRRLAAASRVRPS